MTLLVVGASGFLGAEVCRQAVAAGQRVVGTYHSAAVAVAGVESRRLDVTDRSAARALLTEVRPDAVVATPYRYDDWAVTADGAANIAVAAAEVGARLVHLSSDALHAGRPAPYLDDDPPTPIHAYGAAKAAAETAVRAALFTDEVRCPIDVADLAAAVLELVPADYAGPLNVAGPDAVSRAELGLLVAGHLGVDPSGLNTTTGVAAGVCRPTEVRLDSSRAAGLLRTRLRGVTELLAS